MNNGTEKNGKELLLGVLRAVIESERDDAVRMRAAIALAVLDGSVSAEEAQSFKDVLEDVIKNTTG